MPNDDDLDFDLDWDEDPPERDNRHICNVIGYYIPCLFAVIDEASRIIIGPAKGRINWFTTLVMTKRTMLRVSQDAIKRNLLAWQNQCAHKTLSRFGAFEFVHILLASSFLFLHTVLQ